MERDEVDRDPHLRLGTTPANHLGREPVAEQDVVRGGQRVGLALAAGSVLPESVPEPRDHPRLALRDPMPDAVAETVAHDVDVLGERFGRLTDGPAAALLERLREIPVVERHEGLDARREQLVDQPIVEVETCAVRPAASFREDTRPRDREAERVQPELA